MKQKSPPHPQVPTPMELVLFFGVRRNQRQAQFFEVHTLFQRDSFLILNSLSLIGLPFEVQMMGIEVEKEGEGELVVGIVHLDDFSDDFKAVETYHACFNVF